jgi:hypothetical protein
MLAYHGYGRILSDTTKDQIQYRLMFRYTFQHGSGKARFRVVLTMVE